MEKNDKFGYLDKGFESWFDDIDKKYDLVKVDIDAKKTMNKRQKDNFKNSYIVNLIKNKDYLSNLIESIDRIRIQKSNSGIHLKVYPKKDKFTFWENLYIRILLGDDHAHTITFLKGERDVLFDYKEKLSDNIFSGKTSKVESNHVEDITVVNL